MMWGFMSSDVSGIYADDDVGLHVLGCRVDILGTNCTKLLKVKMGGGEGGGRVALASVRVIMSGGQQGAYCWIK